MSGWRESDERSQMGGTRTGRVCAEGFLQRRSPPLVTWPYRPSPVDSKSNLTPSHVIEKSRSSRDSLKRPFTRYQASLARSIYFNDINV